MNSNYYTPSIFETFNARHLAPAEVAQSFVPPIEIFAELVTRNNHIIMGPRGSGKTTLLKMLTLPALVNWATDGYDAVIPKTEFIGIFVPADKGWHAQLKEIDKGASLDLPSAGHTAFTTHVLLSFIQALEDINKYASASKDPLTKSPSALPPEIETQFVTALAETWQLKPVLKNLSGLKVALRQRMVHLRQMITIASSQPNPDQYFIQEAPYSALNFRDCVSYGVELYEALTEQSGTRWGFLFDEFEVAPSSIQKDVLENLRGSEDGRFVYKVALAPYNKNFMTNLSEKSPSPGNDFRVVDLWYPNKELGYQFSEKLLSRLLAEEEIEVDTLTGVFRASEFGFPEIDEGSDQTQPYEPDGPVRKAFDQLMELDPSFKAYMKERKIDLDNWKSMPEVERAQIRKARSIVVTRNYFRRADAANGNSTTGRSRKIHNIYTGHPTILALCEGNPRILIGIMTPIVRMLAHLRRGSNKKSVERNFQAKQIRSAINSFRSHLKTIPYDSGRDGNQRGLLRLLDKIGAYFFLKAVKEDFSPQPPLSFKVDSHTDSQTLKAVGRALNAGAIVYIPDPGADPILSSLRGKRFRLSYLLAAHYKLPIMLNNHAALSSILSDKKPEEAASLNF